MADNDWVPPQCTLPVGDQPARVAEFDALFAGGVRATTRLAPTLLRLTLDPAYDGVARDLTARESGCCSFFTFAFTRDGADLLLDITVPPTQVPVLDALAATTR